MRTFKRTLKPIKDVEKLTRWWQSFIEKELEQDNLKYLLYLSERTKQNLRSAAIEESELSTGYLSIDFRLCYGHNEATFSYHKSDYPHLLHFPNEIYMNDDEMRTVYQIFEKAPIYFYCYYYRYLCKIQLREMKKRVIIYNKTVN